VFRVRFSESFATMRVLGLVLTPFAAAQSPEPMFNAVPMEVRVPLDVGDCVRAVKSIDYEDLHGNPKIVSKGDKGTLVHVAPDHVVVKWNRQETLARAAAFPHQVRRAQWPKGKIGSIAQWSTGGTGGTVSKPQKCLTVVEYHGFAPMIKPMNCVDNWQNQEFTTPLACRPGQIYWKKDPSLCIDAAHPELVQLKECNGAESQMFSMKDATDHSDPHVSNEGFLVGTGMTKDMCFKFVDKFGDSYTSGGMEATALHFGECNSTKDTKFQFQDMPGIDV